MSIGRVVKSNDLGDFLERGVKEACKGIECTLFRLHTVRSFRGVSNPGDFILFGKTFTAVLECKATLDDYFSCADFYQLKHFESAIKHPHVCFYGVVVCFYSAGPKYVFVSDTKVIENKSLRRRIRLTNPDSFDFVADSLEELFKFFV